MSEITTRIRRGKVVEIPEFWRGEVTHRQTMRKRASHLPPKSRQDPRSPESRCCSRRAFQRDQRFGLEDSRVKP